MAIKNSGELRSLYVVEPLNACSDLSLICGESHDACSDLSNEVEKFSHMSLSPFVLIIIGMVVDGQEPSR